MFSPFVCSSTSKPTFKNIAFQLVTQGNSLSFDLRVSFTRIWWRLQRHVTARSLCFPMVAISVRVCLHRTVQKLEVVVLITVEGAAHADRLAHEGRRGFDVGPSAAIPQYGHTIAKNGLKKRSRYCQLVNLMLKVN